MLVLAMVRRLPGWGGTMGVAAGPLRSGRPEVRAVSWDAERRREEAVELLLSAELEQQDSV
jgi:hypothetical protein